MSSRLVRVLALTTAACLLIATTACGPKTATLPTINGTPTVTAEATSTVEQPEQDVSTGQITTPASGTALRKAVLKAVSTGLGASGTLTVNQLYVQGSAAVGDVKTASGSRALFAVTGGPDAWELTWSAPFGSSLAKVEKLLVAAPEVSPDLAAKLDFRKTLPKPVKAPSLSSFKKYALASAESMASGSYDGTFTVQARIAQDKSGEWWGNALLEPSDDSLEWIGVWGHYVGGKWVGEIADYSEEDADAGFFPKDVLTVLRF